jgi:hypothetical protein
MLRETNDTTRLAELERHIPRVVLLQPQKELLQPTNIFLELGRPRRLGRGRTTSLIFHIAAARDLETRRHDSPLSEAVQMLDRFDSQQTLSVTEKILKVKLT